LLLGAVLLTNLKIMKKWEYKWDTVENYISVIKHHELLSERSSEGWELVSVVMIKVGSDDRMRFYWKRELI
jgi:hypothetical protein